MPEPQPQPSPKEERLGGYRVHPVAALFPMMQGEEFDELVDSIGSCNQKVPIVVDKDVLLDGRNRLKACIQLGIPPRVEQYHPVRNEDPGEWILMMNIQRRHLTADQKIALAAKAYDIIDRAAKERRAAAGREHGGEGGRGHKKPLVVNSPQGVVDPAKPLSDKPLLPIDSKGLEPEKPLPQIRGMGLQRAKSADRNARSGAGQLAAIVSESQRKAAQGIAVQKHAPELLDPIIGGTLKLKDAAKQARAAAPPKPKPKPKPQPNRDDIEKAMDKGLTRAIRCFEKERDQFPESLHAKFTREFIQTVEKL